MIAACFTWRANMTIARRRLTYESIQRKYWDVDYVVARRMLNDYRTRLKNLDLDGLDDFFNPPSLKKPNASIKAKGGKRTTPGSDEPETRISVFEGPREFLSTILNDYELLAIGIENQVMDEKIAKSLLYGTVMNDYTTCRRFIQHLRDQKNNPRIYIKFERLFDRWKECPPNPKKTFGKLKPSKF